MESLGLDLKLFLAQIINFLILFFVLKKFLYGPILKVLDERKKKAQEALTQGKEIEDRLLKLEEERKVVLENERQKGKSETKELIALAENEKEKILAEARQMAEREAKKGIEQIKAQESATAEKLKKDFSKEIVEELISKLNVQNSKDKKYPMLKELLK